MIGEQGNIIFSIRTIKMLPLYEELCRHSSNILKEAIL